MRSILDLLRIFPTPEKLRSGSLSLASRRGRPECLFNDDAFSESISRSEGCETTVSVGPTGAQGTGSELGKDLLRGVVRTYSMML